MDSVAVLLSQEFGLGDVDDIADYRYNKCIGYDTGQHVNIGQSHSKTAQNNNRRLIVIQKRQKHQVTV